MRKVKLRTTKQSRTRPQVPPEEKECLASYVEIGGVKAWTLWDSGSTTSGITPTFAQIADLPVDTLLDPHILQLGTVGSRSIIKYGLNAAIKLSEQKTLPDVYLDVANFDRYDMIIGTPFMHRFKAVLDFERGEVRVAGVRIPAIRVPADLDSRIHRHRLTDKGNKEQTPK
ncbi:hypothetical protein CPC08DRAFT_623762 [Agrocybe pediades]|nr:hypothetical protein CPC08DRAFT_623762 [Agrocybe pediades]